MIVLGHKAVSKSRKFIQFVEIYIYGKEFEVCVEYASNYLYIESEMFLCVSAIFTQQIGMTLLIDGGGLRL